VVGRKTSVVLATLAVTLGGTLALGTGVAVAKGGSPVTLNGITRCTLTGKLTFSPALTGLDSGSSKANVSGRLSHCTNARHGKVKVTGGKIKGLIGLVSPDNCTNLAINHTPPPLGGGSASWASTSAVATSAGLSFPTGTVDIVTVNQVTYLQVSYTGGSVAEGSFANSGGSSITGTTTENDAQLEDRCTSAKGLSSVGFSGTATL
jgi:hypothetical protein